jgi:hypothetical protein
LYDWCVEGVGRKYDGSCVFLGPKESTSKLSREKKANFHASSIT